MFLLALIPGLLICYIVFRIDKYDREPFVPLALCFGLGALATIPAIEVELWAYERLGTAPYNLSGNLLLAFVAIALNEELWKFAVLRVAAFSRPFFNEPLDGIVYAVMIAMGFATMENILYADRFGFNTVLLRAFTAVPAHLVLAIIQGYYAGLARFEVARSRKLLLRGLLLAVLCHGVYDFLIIQRYAGWLAVLASVALYLSLIYCTRLVREHLENSPFHT